MGDINDDTEVGRPAGPWAQMCPGTNLSRSLETVPQLEAPGVRHLLLLRASTSRGADPGLTTRRNDEGLGTALAVTGSLTITEGGCAQGTWPGVPREARGIQGGGRRLPSSTPPSAPCSGGREQRGPEKAVREKGGCVPCRCSLRPAPQPRRERVCHRCGFSCYRALPEPLLWGAPTGRS